MTLIKVLKNKLNFLKLFVIQMLNVFSIIILVIIFGLIFQPISILMKFFRYDPLKKNIDRKSKKSYREKVLKIKKEFKRIF